MYPFDYTRIVGGGKAGSVNQIYRTSWAAVDTPTERSKSVSNYFVIEPSADVFCVVGLRLSSVLF